MTIAQALHGHYSLNCASENGDSFEDHSISRHSVELTLCIREASNAHMSHLLVIRPASHLYLIASLCAQVSVHFFIDVEITCVSCDCRCEPTLNWIEANLIWTATISVWMQQMRIEQDWMHNEYAVWTGLYSADFVIVQQKYVACKPSVFTWFVVHGDAHIHVLDAQATITPQYVKG